MTAAGGGGDAARERAVAPIVTLTVNPCIDESASVEHVVPDRKLRCGAPRYEPGGGGINVARAISRLGGESIAVYPAGGPAGDLLRSLLDREGVAQRALPIGSWTRENFNVLEESTGRQFRFVLPGPFLTPREYDSCLDAIEAIRPSPAFVVASGSLPPGVPTEFYARAAARVRRIGARFVLDTSGDAATAALREGIFLLKPSLGEFQRLAGLVDAEEPHLIAEATRMIEEGGCEIVVLSLGQAGALLVTSDTSERFGAPTVPVRSTVGAGDSLLAGIVLRLAQGRPIREAVRFGVAAAAASVMNPGTELCLREDAERLDARIAERAC